MWLQELMFIFGPLARVFIGILKVTYRLFNWLEKEIEGALCKAFPSLQRFAKGDDDSGNESGEPKDTDL